MSKKNPPNFTTAPTELLSDPNLTPSDKIVYLAIKHRQGRNSHAWPSEDTISKDAGGISTRTVRRAINRLHRYDWLLITRPPLQGRGNTNKYAITAQKKGDKMSAFSQEGGQNVRCKGDKMSSKLDTGNYILSTAFETFWKSYPPRSGKKQDKSGAKRQWEKLKPDEQLFSEIMKALGSQKQCEEWTKDNGRFVPDARKWLYNRRWEDEIETSTEDLVAPVERDAEGRTQHEQMLAKLGL